MQEPPKGQWEEKTGIRSISPNTAARISLTTLAGIVLTVLGFGWVARERLANIEHEQRSHGSLLADLPKRADLVELERRMTGSLRKQMKHAIMRCPKVAARAGAGAWMDCQVIFPQPEE